MVDASNVTSGQLGWKWYRRTSGQPERCRIAVDTRTHSDPSCVCIQPLAAQPLSPGCPKHRFSPSRAEHSSRSYARVGLVAALLLALALLLATSPLHAETLYGRADDVRDGDTIDVQGVAAPEPNQKWGRTSKGAMQRLIAGKRLRCAVNGIDHKKLKRVLTHAPSS